MQHTVSLYANCYQIAVKQLHILLWNITSKDEKEMQLQCFRLLHTPDKLLETKLSEITNKTVTCHKCLLELTTESSLPWTNCCP